MFGFKTGSWDYVTFAALWVIGLGAVLLMLLILGLPGRIAIARKHPEAEAVNLMSWFGFLAVVPWIKALIWVFKPTDVVDIRRFPREEEKAKEEEIMRLSGKSPVGESEGPEYEKRGCAKRTCERRWFGASQGYACCREHGGLLD
jgi:hypothetical protein